MEVITSSFSAYHMYDQARQLSRHGLLKRMHTNYPRNYVRNFMDDVDRVSVHLMTGIGHRLAKSSRSIWRVPSRRRIAVRLLSDLYDHEVSQQVSSCNVFIGLSGYCEKTLTRVSVNTIKICDYGSLHLKSHRRWINRERLRLGLNEIGEGSLELKQNNEFALSDKILVCSSLAKQSFVENGYSAEKIMSVPLGSKLRVNEGTFSNSRDSDDHTFVYAGGLTVSKGVHRVIDAFLKCSIKNKRLVLIGSTENIDELVSVVGRDVIYGRKDIILTGALSKRDMVRMYQSCQVFVFPSFGDGFGMAVSEALGCGLWCLVSENAGCIELITEDINGNRFSPTDTDRLIELMERTARYPKGIEMSSSYIRTWDEYGADLSAMLNLI